MKLIAIVMLAALCGCQKAPVQKEHAYTDTPQGRTARYVHDHCTFLHYYPPEAKWNDATGQLETSKGEGLYRCPDRNHFLGEAQYIVIYDDEEQP